MNAITEELKKTGTFYVATVEGDQPRVRPFGAVAEFEGKTYICTNNTKACYAQMLANPKTEICGMQPDGSWVRISGNLVRDDRDVKFQGPTIYITNAGLYDLASGMEYTTDPVTGYKYGTNTINIGTEYSSGVNTLKQDIFTLEDNLSW